MKALVILLAAAACCASLPASAEVIQIPLADLQGTYPDGQTVEKFASFDLGFAPEKVNGAWIQFTGTATTAILECDGGSTDVWGMEFYVMIPDDTTGGRWAAFQPGIIGEGIFAFLWPFGATGSQTPTWNFLADGRGEVWFYGGPTPLVGLCGPVTPPPEALVDEVVLVLDVNAAVGVQPTTWGSVKALYNH